MGRGVGGKAAGGGGRRGRGRGKQSAQRRGARRPPQRAQARQLGRGFPHVQRAHGLVAAQGGGEGAEQLHLELAVGRRAVPQRAHDRDPGAGGAVAGGAFRHAGEAGV